MASDGQVIIDLSLNRSGIESDLEWLSENLHRLGGNVDDSGITSKIETAMNDAKATVNTAAEEINHEKLLPTISANDDSLKEKVTETREVIDKIPDKKETTFSTNDESSEPLERIKDNTEETSESTRNFSSTLRSTALGMGIYSLAMKAGVAISDEFMGAVSRYDTLNNYPRVLESMGVSAKDANASMMILKRGVDGLPTSLDDVARVTQRFIPLSKNAKDAARSALALNDAFLASGASAEDTSRGLEQYSQMLSSGKVDMMSWRTLEETMPASLQKVARSFGITSGSTQELYKRLASGKITMRQLNEHFEMLDKGTNGFHATALKTTAGIGTAFKNMGNRIRAGLAEALKGLDSLVKALTGKSIAQNINSLTSHFGKIGAVAEKALIGLGRALKPLMSYIRPLIPVIATFIATLAGLTVVRAVGAGIIFLVRSFFNLGKGLKTNLKIAIIMAFISALVELYKHNAKFRNFVNGIIKSVKNFAKNFEKHFKGLISDVSKLLKGNLGWEKGIASNLKRISGTISKESGIWIAMFKRVTNQIIQPVRKAFDGIYKYIEPDLKRIPKIISSVTRTVSAIWNKCWSGLSKVIMPVFKTISKFVNSHMTQIRNIINDVLKVVLILWNTAWKQVENVFKLVWDLIFHRARVADDVKRIITTAIKAIQAIWNNVWNAIKNYFNIIWDANKEIAKIAINIVKDIISNTIKRIQTIWNSIWNGIKSFFDGIWNDIKNIASSAINWVCDTINNILGKILDTWHSMWSSLRDFFGSIWSDIKSVGQDSINWLRSILFDVLNSINNFWNNIWNAIKNVFSNIWDNIKNIGTNSIEALDNVLKSTLNTISDTWHSTWNALGNFFNHIWDNIKHYAAEGMDGVIHVINVGIDGIDSVWKFFTGHRTSVHHLRPVHFAQGGIVDRHLSMVNDGAGSNWKELIETPSGKLMMSNERNAILPLETGTRVYSGEETKSIMDLLGVSHYASGGIVGNLIQWGSHSLSDFGKWIKDKWKAVTTFLKDPLKNTVALIDKAIATPLAHIKIPSFVDLGRGLFDKLTKPIADWFKKGLTDLKNKHDAEVEYGGGYFHGGAGVARWAPVIDKAAQEMGVSLSGDQKSRLLRQIATESGGNETIVQQIVDINSLAGNPARGLLQFIPQTFAHWALPGHTNINSGMDQIMAAINALNHGGEGGWSNIGDGHGWDSGGRVNNKELAWIAENNAEYVINPQKPNADYLLEEAAFERLNYAPNSNIAKALAGLNNAQINNGYMVPNSSIEQHYITQAGSSNGTTANSKIGKISLQIDGRAIASATYPFNKILQGQDVMLQNRKGGGALV